MKKLKKPHALSILIASILFINLPIISAGGALNNNSGYLTFYDASGGQAISPVLFSDSSKGKIAALNLSNNNVFIAYISGDENGRGMYTITDQFASQVKAPAQFTENKISEVEFASLNNNNIMIAYNDSIDNKGKLVYYNQEGQYVSGPTVFSASAIDNISILELNNGNVLMLYNNKTLGKGCFQIYSQEGGQARTEMIFSENPVAYISPVSIADNNIFVAYSDQGATKQGKYFIMNRDGNISLLPLVYANNNTEYNSSVVLDNTNIMLAYSDGSDSNYGKISIYNKSGNIVLDNTYFNKTATAKINASRLNNNNIMISFADASDANKGKFALFGQAGNSVLEATTFSTEPVGYITPSQMANRNQLIAFNIASVRACTSTDWTSTLEPLTCPESGKQTKTWTNTGTCSGGVSYPSSEEVSCTIPSELPACLETDWIYKIEPADCPASGKQNKIWQTIRKCSGGVSHENNEKITCTYSPENKVIKVKNQKLYKALKGKIIIKVNDLGKAYFVDTKTLTLYYLGRPSDAFSVMRNLGLGISNSDLSRIPQPGQKANRANTTLINSLKGKILLQVQGNGEAWYVNPADGLRYYLGRPADAFAVMRNLGLGISNNDFDNFQK